MKSGRTPKEIRQDLWDWAPVFLLLGLSAVAGYFLFDFFAPGESRWRSGHWIGVIIIGTASAGAAMFLIDGIYRFFRRLSRKQTAEMSVELRTRWDNFSDTLRGWNPVFFLVGLSAVGGSYLFNVFSPGENMWKDSRWVWPFMFAGGLLCGVLFLYQFGSRILIRLTGIRTEGTVTLVEKKRVMVTSRSKFYSIDSPVDNSMNSFFREEEVTFYHKAFRFTDLSGKEHIVESNVETDTAFHEGEPVKVIYSRFRPKKAKIFSHLEYYAWSYFFGGMFIVLTVVGFLFMMEGDL